MNASEFGCGHGHQLAITWAKVGGELADFTTLSQNPKKCQQVIAYLRGEAEIVVKSVETVAQVVVEKTVRLLRFIKEVTLKATPDKKTVNCFIGSRYHHRDADLDSWLPKVQPTGKAGQFSVSGLEREMTFKEVATAILKVGETSGLDFLVKTLIENGHTVTLPQIESLIERTDAGEDTGLRTDGYINFFFVINKEDGVSVVYVYRYGGWQWRVRVSHFGVDQWRVGRRFFSRNSSS